MKKLAYLLPISLLAPLVTFAQSGNGLAGVLEVIYNLLQDIIPILIILAVIFFFYGLALFILNAGNDEKRKKGVSTMIYGIIALFIIVSVWGLVAILQNTFNVNQSVTTVQGPQNINETVPNGGLPY